MTLNIWEHCHQMYATISFFFFVNQDMLPQERALHQIQQQHDGLKCALTGGRKTGECQANQLGLFDTFLPTDLPTAHV